LKDLSGALTELNAGRNAVNPRISGIIALAEESGTLAPCLQPTIYRARLLKDLSGGLTDLNAGRNAVNFARIYIIIAEEESGALAPY
jgi:hypothetical protein